MFSVLPVPRCRPFLAKCIIAVLHGSFVLLCHFVVVYARRYFPSRGQLSYGGEGGRDVIPSVWSYSMVCSARLDSSIVLAVLSGVSRVFRSARHSLQSFIIPLLTLVVPTLFYCGVHRSPVAFETTVGLSAVSVVPAGTCLHMPPCTTSSHFMLS